MAIHIAEDDETYVDTKYVFSTLDKDSLDSVISGVDQPPDLPARHKSVHLYSEPEETQAIMARSQGERHIRNFYAEQLNNTDHSK